MIRKTQEMTLIEWLALLDDLGWVSADGGATTFSERDAVLAFVWSRTVIVDEVKKHIEYITMRFHDFLEVGARRGIIARSFVFGSSLSDWIMTRSILLSPPDPPSAPPPPFHDFLEALARVAEMKAIPTDDELLAASAEGEMGVSPTE